MNKKWVQAALLSLLASVLVSTTVTHAQQQSDSVEGTIISRDVLVAEGDTLRSLAKRELGKTGLAPLLAQFNGLVESAPLTPGNIIRIPIHVPARGEFAEVVFVKGGVFVLRTDTSSIGAQSAAQVASAASTAQTGGSASSGASIELQRNDEVHSGDIISTGPDGYISIEFSSGSVINLQPDTEAKLIRLNCLPSDDSCLIELNTTRGKLNSDVETRDNQPVDFRISTPYASAAVRGTIFDIDATGETLITGVTQGEVSLSAQQQTVGLDEGFGSLVEAGEAPSRPIALLPAPVFKRVPARVAQGDSVSWWPFSDAASYGALLAFDEAGQQTLANFDINADSIGFESIESGDYFLIIRAIDTNGLQGFTSNTRLTIADIDDEISPVQTTVDKQGREFLVSVIDPPVNAAGFEIQISSTEDFSDPLSVDVNNNGSAVFRLDNDQVFTRARVLLDPFTVSAYGTAVSSGN
ncbi:MAG: FecR domain-containing protein [Granulosicoccus sp.]